MFLSAMRIFGFGNIADRYDVQLNDCFYPQCGFLALGTEVDEADALGGVWVSIRNADFWLWELLQNVTAKGLPQQFLSAMRIFGFGNLKFKAVSIVELIEFLSAMRIFGFGNTFGQVNGSLYEFSFYPQCGFLALGTHTNIYAISKSISFYPQCGFLALGTLFSDCDELFACCFYPQCGFLALGTRVFFQILFEFVVSIRNADFWLWEPR